MSNVSPTLIIIDNYDVCISSYMHLCIKKKFNIQRIAYIACNSLLFVVVHLSVITASRTVLLRPLKRRRPATTCTHMLFVLAYFVRKIHYTKINGAK